MKINQDLLAKVRARVAEQGGTKQQVAAVENRIVSGGLKINLAKLAQQHGHQVASTVPTSTEPTTVAEAVQEVVSTPLHRADGIQYNEKQLAFVELASSGKSSVLIGAAGTGKTTCMKGVVSALIANDLAGVIGKGQHPLLEEGTPGIVVVSFTRRAVANIRKQMPPELKKNCLTIHKLLEYQPVTDGMYDQVSGETKKRNSSLV